MNKNMGNIDRAIRTMVALTIITLYLTDNISGLVAIVLGMLALIFLLTSVISFCPLYAPFKISTCKKE